MKFCRNCEKLLPLEEFPIRGEASRAYAKGTCFSCKKKKKRNYYETNKASILAKQAAYQKSPHVKKYQAAYFQLNKEKNYAATKRWREKNPQKQKEILANDYLSRKHFWRGYVAKRRAVLLQAIPAWADRKELERIYRNCPEGMHVDHIIPLSGKGVRGLHVPWNLQYLAAKENMQKGNRI